MNTTKISIPNFLIADFYKGSLVIIQEESSKEQSKEKQVEKTLQRQWYLGDNQRRITVVVNENETLYLKDSSLQLLLTILGACKLNLGDVAIVNYQQNPVDYAFLKEKLSPAFVILFDVAPDKIKLPFTVPNYQVQQYDHCAFLPAPALEMMLGESQQAKLEKSKLWLCLKKMFQV